MQQNLTFPKIIDDKKNKQPCPEMYLATEDKSRFSNFVMYTFDSTHINDSNARLFGTPNTCNYTHSRVKYKMNTIFSGVDLKRVLFQILIFCYVHKTCLLLTPVAAA